MGINNRTELTDREEVRKSLAGQTSKLIKSLEERLAVQETDGQQSREQLGEQVKELADQSELIRAYEVEEKQWQEEKRRLQEELSQARRNRDRFKDDAKENRGILKEYDALIEQYEQTLDEILCALVNLVPLKVVDDEHDATGLSDVGVLATGVFVCCGDEHLHVPNQQHFEKITKLLPEVDFGDRLVFVSNKNLVRPEIPIVDLAILFTKGLSHTDGDVLRNEIRTNSDHQMHICTHQCSVSLIVLEVRQWLTNPSFAQVSGLAER